MSKWAFKKKRKGSVTILNTKYYNFKIIWFTQNLTIKTNNYLRDTKQELTNI